MKYTSWKTKSRGKLNIVVVLMATYNGLRWLPEQVDSILKQTEVDVRLFISDDLSTDGTWDWLQKLADQENLVTLLPQTRKFGSAAANFYRLILDVDTTQCNFIAFSDQDDIWELDKLSRHIRIASQGGFDGVSSDVAAFWAGRTIVNIVKSQAQREFDYLFESAGPGCTYLLTPWLVGELRNLLLDTTSSASNVALHDWLAYAVCRAAERRWHIDDVPTVRYRQHSANEFGANHGLRAKISRLKKLKNGWYRSEVLSILNVCMIVKPYNPTFEDLSRVLCTRGVSENIQLLLYVNRARRRVIDRIALAAAIVLFLF